MAQTPQTFQNHARFFPLFHFFIAPVLMINFFVTVWQLYRQPSGAAAWNVVIALTLVLLATAARLMALTVQDRVVRLEMRLRMQQVLPTDLLARVGEITRPQFVALRFASDAELPDLTREVLSGRLTTQKAIKERVRNWQPDNLRA
jgi:hypothetical protein